MQRVIVLSFALLATISVLAEFRIGRNVPPIDHELAVHEFSIAPASLTAILERKVLRAITYFGPTNYYISRGEERGFEFELAKAFAHKLGVKLEVIIPPDLTSAYDWLADGAGDLVILPYTDNLPLPPGTIPSYSYDQTNHVIVALKENDNQHKYVDSRLDIMTALTDSPIHVIQGSGEARQLHELNESLNAAIKIREIPANYTALTLGNLLKKQEAKAICVDEQTAQNLNHRMGGRLTISDPIGGSQKISWVLPASASKLQSATNSFLASHAGKLKYSGKRQVSRLYRVLKYKYTPTKTSTSIARQVSFTPNTISPFDKQVRKVAEKYGLDHRLLLAVMYVESRFDPKARSEAGAEGLMQLIPATFVSLGFNQIHDISQNIEAGAAYLRILFYRLRHFGQSEDDRLRLVLASYNAGVGHVLDAIGLAKKLGWNAKSWLHGVETALHLLQDENYYKHVRYGYCRSDETIDYVEQTMTQYNLYRKLVKS